MHRSAEDERRHAEEYGELLVLINPLFIYEHAFVEAAVGRRGTHVLEHAGISVEKEHNKEEYYLFENKKGRPSVLKRKQRKPRVGKHEYDAGNE
jgi:hypothetical protein